LGHPKNSSALLAVAAPEFLHQFCFLWRTAARSRSGVHKGCVIAQRCTATHNVQAGMRVGENRPLSDAVVEGSAPPPA